MPFIQMAVSDTLKLQNYHLINIVALVLISNKDILPSIFLLDAERFKRHQLPENANSLHS